MNNYITGAAIRALREKNRLTQQQLAEKLCVSDKAISKWETGVSHIHSLIASSMLCISLYPRFLTEQAGKQRYKGHADKGDTAARHELLHALAFRAGIVVAVALHEVNHAPDTKPGSQSYNKGLQNAYCRIKKCHKVLLSCRVCGCPKKGIKNGGQF